jgi:hypothetical protein
MQHRTDLLIVKTDGGNNTGMIATYRAAEAKANGLAATCMTGCGARS